MELPEGVVDVHVHIQPWEQLRPEVRAAMLRKREDLAEVEAYQRDPDAFAAFLERSGIARVGLVNYPAPEIMGFDETTNDFVAAYRDKRPDRFFAWGGLHPRFLSDPAGEMTRLLDELRLDGIKIHPPHQNLAPNAYLFDQPGLRVVYERCEERGVPVMVHTGTSIFPGARSRLGDPMLCDDVAVDFPKLKLVMAHCGRPLWYEEAFFVARRHENVLVDLSGIPPKQLPEKLPRLELLAGKVLWGTDWPSPGVYDLRRNLQTFLELDGFSDHFKLEVLVTNPARHFPSPERPSTAG